MSLKYFQFETTSVCNHRCFYWRRWVSKEEAREDFICRSCAYAIEDNYIENLRA